MNNNEEKKKTHRTEIWLAILGLIGVLGGAVIANWDKLFPKPVPVIPPVPSPIKINDQTVSVKVIVIVRAADFVRGSGVALAFGQVAVYGSDVLLNGPPYHKRPNAAEFEFRVATAGTYRMYAEYAAAAARPVAIKINGILVISNAMSAPTGCWELNCQRWMRQGEVQLQKGLNVMRIERQDVFPHIRNFKFEPVE